jgi:hypothetical protein
MRQVSLADIVGPSRYAEMRSEFRKRIIELKRDRRVSVGDKVTFVFENFDTVHFQIQEMLHVERITDVDKVRDEIAVYNELLPGKDELSATMLIEITDQTNVREDLVRLIGIDESVFLAVGDERFRAVFEEGRSNEEKLSAVQYVRFHLPVAAQRALSDPTVPAEIVIEHPNYRARSALAPGVRASLAADFVP